MARTIFLILSEVEERKMPTPGPVPVFRSERYPRRGAGMAGL